MDHASVRAEVPLGPMMHLRIGGAAEWFVEPFDEQGVCATVSVSIAWANLPILVNLSAESSAVTAALAP